MAIVVLGTESDPRVDRVGRGVRDVGREEDLALAAREQLPRQVRHQGGRRSRARGDRARCYTGAIRAKSGAGIVEAGVGDGPVVVPDPEFTARRPVWAWTSGPVPGVGDAHFGRGDATCRSISHSVRRRGHTHGAWRWRHRHRPTVSSAGAGAHEACADRPVSSCHLRANASLPRARRRRPGARPVRARSSASASAASTSLSPMIAGPSSRRWPHAGLARRRRSRGRCARRPASPASCMCTQP